MACLMMIIIYFQGQSAPPKKVKSTPIVPVAKVNISYLLTRVITYSSAATVGLAK